MPMHTLSPEHAGEYLMAFMEYLPGNQDCIRFHSRLASSKLWESDVRFWHFLHSSQPKEPSAPTWTVPEGRPPQVEHD